MPISRLAARSVGSATWRWWEYSTPTGRGRDRDWVDARVLQGVYRRGNSYQLVMAPRFVGAFDTSATVDHQPQLNCRSCARVSTTPSSRHAEQPMGGGFGIALLMGIGACSRDSHMYTPCRHARASSPRCGALGFNSGSWWCRCWCVTGARGHRGVIGAARLLRVQRLPDITINF